MPFSLRPYRRFPVQWSVSYNAGPFHGQSAPLQYSSFLPSLPSLHPFRVLFTEVPGA